MNPAPKRTQFIVEVHEHLEGRTTRWPVTCPDDCDELKGVRPISRERGTWFAMDHLNSAHGGAGAIKVHRAKKTKGRKHGRK